MQIPPNINAFLCYVTAFRHRENVSILISRKATNIVKEEEHDQLYWQRTKARVRNSGTCTRSVARSCRRRLSRQYNSLAESDFNLPWFLMAWSGTPLSSAAEAPLYPKWVQIYRRNMNADGTEVSQNNLPRSGVGQTRAGTKGVILRSGKAKVLKNKLGESRLQGYIWMLWNNGTQRINSEV